MEGVGPKDQSPPADISKSVGGNGVTEEEGATGLGLEGFEEEEEKDVAGGDNQGALPTRPAGREK